MSAKCKSCGAPIRWVTTLAGGKAMPLDEKPVAGGNIVLTHHGKAIVITPNDTATGEPTYVSHFATCAHAAQHRKAKP